MKFRDKTVVVDTGVGEIGGSVYRLYKAAFDRVPDRDGLNYWINRMDTAINLEQLASEFVSSREFLSLYSEMSHRELIHNFYLNVLDRPPDPSGLAYWTQQLESGNKTVTKILMDFSESVENVTLVGLQIANGFDLS